MRFNSEDDLIRGQQLQTLATAVQSLTEFEKKRVKKVKETPSNYKDVRFEDKIESEIFNL